MADNEKKRKPRTKKFWGTLAVIAVVFAAAGFGFYQWHETPGFCGAICHNMDPYLETYEQEQGVAGHDKYGNEMTDTNAAMSTLHRVNQTTAKPTITCLNCHVPTIPEQVSEGVAMVTGNYYAPLDERWGNELTKWQGTDGTTFCANENCHSYLLGDDGLVNREKLAQVTARMEFNPHDTHHANAQMTCTNCHKGHRASVMQCTACHEHENVQVPEGWLTAEQSEQLMLEAMEPQAA